MGLLGPSDSYRFRTSEACWLDCDVFERGLRCARGDLNDARWMEAISRYEAALAFYRGEFLAEERYTEWAASRRGELLDKEIVGLCELAGA